MEKKYLSLTHGKGHDAPSMIKLLEKLGGWKVNVTGVYCSPNHEAQSWEIELTRDNTGHKIAKKIEAIESRGIVETLKQIVKQRIVTRR